MTAIDANVTIPPSATEKHWFSGKWQFLLSIYDVNLLLNLPFKFWTLQQYSNHFELHSKTLQAKKVIIIQNPSFIFVENLREI